MKDLISFSSEKFGNLRTAEIDGTIWFVGKDVAKALGYTNPNEAIQEHVDEDDKLNSKSLSSFEIKLGQRGGWLINESGVYSLVLSSKLEGAKEFKHWVTSEVLPSLRKTGSYSVNQNAPDLTNLVKVSENLLVMVGNLVSNAAETNARITSVEDLSVKMNNRLVSLEKKIADDPVLNLPKMEPRARINEVVRDFAKKNLNGDVHEAFCKLYREFYYLFKIKLTTEEAKENGYATILDYVEHIGKIKELEALSIKLFVKKAA